MLACGKRALARVSYMTSTRAKAPPTPNQTVLYYTKKLTLFVPGLTFNAVAETIIGLFKTEVIHRLGPWKTADAVEWALLRKSAVDRGSPFPGRTYPTASVTGIPSAV